MFSAERRLRRFSVAARVRVRDRVARELELQLVQLRRRRCVERRIAAATWPGTLVSVVATFGTGTAEEQAARLLGEAVVVRVAAGQPLVRVEVVVDAHHFLPRVVDRRRELRNCARPGTFGAGNSAEQLDRVRIAQRRRARSSRWSGRSATPDRRRSRSATVGARLMRRSSSEKKKNILLGIAGPPTVPPKLLYFSGGGVLLIVGIGAQVAEERVRVELVAAQELVDAAGEARRSRTWSRR